MLKIIPFGNRILCKRQIIGEKAGSLYMPDEVKERATDMAEVTYIPDLTFGDRAILDNAEQIINSIIEQAKTGNSYAINTLLELNNFIKEKSIKVGDKIFISKYVGTTFVETGKTEELTIVNNSDIIGLCIDDEVNNV